MRYERREAVQKFSFYWIYSKHLFQIVCRDVYVHTEDADGQYIGVCNVGPMQLTGEAISFSLLPLGHPLHFFIFFFFFTGKEELLDEGPLTPPKSLLPTRCTLVLCIHLSNTHTHKKEGGRKRIGYLYVAYIFYIKTRGMKYCAAPGHFLPVDIYISSPLKRNKKPSAAVCSSGMRNLPSSQHYRVKRYKKIKHTWTDAG